MKKFKIIIIGALLTACNFETDTNQLEMQDSIMADSLEASIDSIQSAFIANINEIDQNLEMIRQNEGYLVLGPNSNVDPELTPRDRILRNIQMINSLLESNRNKISELQVMLSSSKADNKKMKGILQDRESSFADLTAEIELHKAKLAENDFRIEELSAKLSERDLQMEIMNSFIDELNFKISSAYYVVGTSRELKDRGIIARNGGFLGIGQTKKLDGDFDEEYFTAVDTRKTTEIPIHGKKVRVLTSHPSASYEFQSEEDIITKMVISDAEKFWKANKYLVVEISI